MFMRADRNNFQVSRLSLCRDNRISENGPPLNMKGALYQYSNDNNRVPCAKGGGGNTWLHLSALTLAGAGEKEILNITGVEKGEGNNTSHVSEISNTLNF